MARSKLETSAFLSEKVITVDFSETFAASDLKGGRWQVLYVLCFSRPRYQVSVYRTIGPLVLIFAQNIDCGYTLEPPQ